MTYSKHNENSHYYNKNINFRIINIFDTKWKILLNMG